MTFINAGLAVLHIATGAFFTVTGARKLFNDEVHAKVSGLLARHGVPPALQLLTMAGEFLGGLGLLAGALTQLAALGLVPIMVGAFVMGAWDGVVAKQDASWGPAAGPSGVRPRRVKMDWSRVDWSQLFSNALCTPEAQLLIIVVVLALTGAGSYSLDGLFAK